MQIKTKIKGLNVRGASHHLLLPIIAVLIVAGIGGFIMQRNSSALVKPCSERVFRQGSSSVCTKYVLTIIKRSGKSATAKTLTPGSNFGPKTKKAVQEYQRKSGLTADGVIGPKTWGKLCTAATTAEKTKIGCNKAKSQSKKTVQSSSQKFSTSAQKSYAARNDCKRGNGVFNERSGTCKYPPEHYKRKLTCTSAGYKWGYKNGKLTCQSALKTGEFCAWSNAIVIGKYNTSGHCVKQNGANYLKLTKGEFN